MMNFINPIGVTPQSGIAPRACMCHDSAGFANARGGIFTNTCKKCGCQCAANNTSNFNANHNTALNTDRKS